MPTSARVLDLSSEVYAYYETAVCPSAAHYCETYGVKLLTCLSRSRVCAKTDNKNLLDKTLPRLTSLSVYRLKKKSIALQVRTG